MLTPWKKIHLYNITKLFNCHQIFKNKLNIIYFWLTNIVFFWILYCQHQRVTSLKNHIERNVAMKGHVRKRGRKWCFVLDVGQDPTTGKRKQKWFSGFKTKKDAEKAMAKTIHELDQGTYVEPKKITLAEYLPEWLDNHGKHNLKPTTYATYSCFIKNHIIPSLGSLTLNQLQPLHLQKFYTKKLENGRTDGKGGLSPQSVRYLHAILRKALDHAVKWQIINRNVAKFVDPPPITKIEITTLTSEQVADFLYHAKNDRYYIAFLLAVTTGLRRGEILALRWQDIDFQSKVASIRRSLVLVDNKTVFQDPKTYGSQRSISLPNLVMIELERHQRIQRQERISKGNTYQNNDLIITTSLGTPVSPRNLLRSFKKILKKASLPDIRLHDIRHTHATLMLQQGEHPKIVSERLGHSNTRVTLDTYSHVLPNMQKDAVERFEKYYLNFNHSQT